MSDPTAKHASNVFTAFAWAMLVYLIGVILFGAWVRITGSGAGCGSHWPTCHGQIIPHSPSIETMIEYTHRLTSGLCGIFGLALWIAAARRFGAGSRVAIAALATLSFIGVEGAIGAGLVLQELVVDNASEARAAVISLHLVNTLSLVAVASLVAWWSRPRTALAFPQLRRALGGLLMALVLVSMTGAVTALGDTLFPVVRGASGIVEHVMEELSATQHFLIRLRIVHPILAILVAAWAWRIALAASDDSEGQTRTIARLALWTVIAQVVVGLANIGLGAPGWMQLVHLFLAESLWISFLLLYLSSGPDRSKAGSWA
jgi:heme A synthase